MVQKREAARKAKNWKEADAIGHNLKPWVSCLRIPLRALGGIKKKLKVLPPKFHSFVEYFSLYSLSAISFSFSVNSLGSKLDFQNSLKPLRQRVGDGVGADFVSEFGLDAGDFAFGDVGSLGASCIF